MLPYWWITNKEYFIIKSYTRCNIKISNQINENDTLSITIYQSVLYVILNNLHVGTKLLEYFYAPILTISNNL